MVEDLDGVFHALADSTRRAMLRQLAEHECTVTQLAAPFSISLAASSKHVQVLERAGLVRRTVEGRRHICRLAPEPLAEANSWLRYYERHWAGSLDRLETLMADRQEDR